MIWYVPWLPQGILFPQKNAKVTTTAVTVHLANQIILKKMQTPSFGILARNTAPVNSASKLSKTALL